MDNSSRINEVPEGAHSILGPSSAERWLNCPGSVLATKDLPDTPSQYALEGTAAHTVSEWVRLQGRPAKDFLGVTIRITRGDYYWDIECDQEMVDSVQEFVDKVGEFEGHELVEERVRYNHYVLGGFGTLDSAKLSPGLGRITDFKHGQGVKKWAKENPQLMLYAIGVYLDWNWLYDFEKFVLAISQPRLDHYDEWEISVADLLKWAIEVVVPAGMAARKEGAPFKAGEWCQFCKLKATCRTRAESMFETLTGDFKDLDLKNRSLDLFGQQLSNDEIAAVLENWPQIEKWGAALKAHAMQEVMQGRAVGEMKLVAGRSVRGWNAADQAIVDAIRAQFPDFWPWEPQTLLSVAAAEKQLGKKNFAGLPAALTRKADGRPTLVPGSDPRPVIDMDALSEFHEITEE